mmetsp:Transcript_62223/g.135111  ORF Transcript_62223/g.135111 Transcript_62223/m.135111 type:complete len:125 (-) Transcript_62223:234-608(-)
MTTLVIHNLPHSLEDQETALSFLIGAEFAGRFDFFLHLPEGLAQPTVFQEGLPESLSSRACAFVNFCDHASAQAYLEGVHGMDVGMELKLNVVWSGVQGLEACRNHFKAMMPSGCCRPWTPQSG